MEPDWTRLKDEELLKLRICDLDLKIEGSELEPRIQKLYQELEAKNLRFRPKIYLGDEWFSPEGMVAIAVPFYFAHPRLLALEKKIMLEVEGEEPEYFQMLLRHEAGHCFDHAYRFSKKRDWQTLFGSPDKDYAPETYHPRPYSKSFVRHLENWYAQAHPDEDFAETFAVWLNPDRDWKAEYSKWGGALEKIQYIDSIARKVAKKTPTAKRGYLPFSASRMKTTLEKYYAKRRREQAEDYPDFYDEDLKKIFDGPKTLSKREYGAFGFMRRSRVDVVTAVGLWTGEKKYTVNALVKKLTARCDSLDLRLGKTESQTILQVAAYLASLVTHYLFTGKFKRTV